MKKQILIIISTVLLSVSGCIKNKKDMIVLDETKIQENKQTPENIDLQKSAKESEQTNNQDEVQEIGATQQKGKSLHSIESPRLPAVVKSENSSSISFQISGIITKINVKAGDVVKRDQLLAVLDSTDASLALENAKIDSESKKIIYQQEAKKYESYLSLFKNGSLSKVAFEDEESNAKLAKLNYESAENNVKTKEQSLKLTRITAPFDGVVSKSHRSLGDFVTPGTQVFDVVQMNDLVIFAQVPFEFFGKITAGMILKTFNPINREQTKMEVQKIVPIIDAQTRTFDIYGKITDTNPTFTPGMYVEIILE